MRAFVQDHMFCVGFDESDWILIVKKIIIVDDEPAIVRMTQQKMKRLGYVVTGTTNPKEALEWVKSNPDQYDLLLTDMVMPKLNGAQLSKAVLKIRPDLPIVLCSGFCMLSEQECKNMGICKVLKKPVDWFELADAVQEVLGVINDEYSSR